MTWLIRAATCIFGFTLGIALAPSLPIAARSSDLPSALKVAGYSPTGLILQFVLAVTLAVLFAVIGDRVARLLAGYRWAAALYSTALLLAPVTLMHSGNVRHLALHAVVAAAVVALRKRDPHFDRGDAVLLPIFLSCTIAFLDLGFGRTPVATSLRAAIAVLAIRLIVRSSDRMVPAALALIAQVGWLPPRIGAAMALIVIFATPFLRIPLPRRIAYPIALFAYPLAVLSTSVSVVNFFEDSNDIPVAAEMLRGERPYRDVIPVHGFITDGALSFAAMKVGLRSLPALLMVRRVAGALTAVAIYCVTLAATGDAEVALLSVFLALSLFGGVPMWLRPCLALFALAATVAAVRLRSRRWFIAAGALVVFAFLLSVDFGTYSAVIGLFAAFRARALRSFAIGIAAAAAPVALLFLAFGFLGDFVRVTVVDVLAHRGAWAIRPITFPDCLRGPEFFDHLGEPECMSVFLWIVALAATCAVLARRPLRGTRSDAPWLIGAWIVVAGASYIDRGNVFFNVAGASFILAALHVLWRPMRAAAMAITIVVVLFAHPFRHVITFLPAMRAPRPQATFDPQSAASVQAATKFVSSLPAGATFIDFANSALLYYLTGRDAPLRRLQVGMMESDAAQKEVIESIDRNRRIQAALIAFPGSDQRVDGVPNADRAPLVWQYLQQHFAPAFAENGVVFWKRVR